MPQQETSKLVQIVSKIPIFKDLTPAQVRKILAACSHKVCKAGDQVCRCNTPSDEMFILISGELAVVTIEGIRVANIAPVTTVGEMGVFTGQPRSASVEATRDCSILTIRKIQLDLMLRDDEEMRVKVFRHVVDILAEKLSSDNVRLRDYQIDKGSSKDRIAMLERQLAMEERRLQLALDLASEKGDLARAEIELFLEDKMRLMLDCVLVVDDEPEVLSNVRKVLSGYAVIEAENGQQALNVVREERVSRVLTDIRMPEMDGFGLLGNLRSQFPQMPVLATSGYLDREGLEGTDFDGFIEKPLSLDLLQNTVEETLAESR